MKRARLPRPEPYLVAWAVVALVVVGTALLLNAVVQRQKPDEPWVQIDRTAGASTFEPGPRLGPDTGVSVEVDVPESGLDRVDIRVAGTSTAGDGTLEMTVVDSASDRVLSTASLPLAMVPEDQYASILLEPVAHERAAAVRIDFRAKGLPKDAEVALWQAQCDCIQAAHFVGESGPGDLLTRDLDMATYALVDSPSERVDLVEHRIDRTHPPRFGARTAAVSGMIALAAFLAALTLVLGQRVEAIHGTGKEDPQA